MIQCLEEKINVRKNINESVDKFLYKMITPAEYGTTQMKSRFVGKKVLSINNSDYNRLKDWGFSIIPSDNIYLSSVSRSPSQRVFIYKLEDDYYCLKHNYDNHTHYYYLCDTIDGVIQWLENIKW